MPDPRASASASRAARLLPLLVLLSGAAALVCASLWVRSFGLVFGTTTGAVALVLVVLFGGLALGGAAAARSLAADPLAVYGLVEMGTGACALLTLPLLRVLPAAGAALRGAAGPGGAVEAVGRMLLAGVVLLPAAFLLGARLPLALAFLEQAGADPRAGFGRLYRLGALGGAAGVLLTTYVLLPSLGVRATLVAAAACHLFAGGLARRWAREIGAGRATTPAAPGLPTGPSPAPRDGSLALALAVASGAATLGLEALWTRSLALVVGATVYAVALAQVAVLLGIALGAAAYGRRRERVARPARVVGLLFLAAGLAALAGQWVIGRLPEAYLVALRVLPLSFAWQQAATLGLCVAAVWPATLVLGASFPLLLHLLGPGPGRSPRESGRLLAAGAAGAIAGLLAAHLWLVPRLGLQPPYLVFAGLLLAGAAWALARAHGLSTMAGAASAVALLALAGLVAPRWKPWDPVVMSAGVHRYGLEWRASAPAFRLGPWLREQRSLLFYREGAEAVVAVSEPKGSPARFLSVDGKAEAGSAPEDVVTQKLLAHVPLLLHPQPRRALLLGWGAGTTAASMALHPLESLECVERERATWEAGSFFAPLGLLKSDGRFRVVFADARAHLLRSRALYDVIVAEPSDPRAAGIAGLFTREFDAIALSRLAAGGLFGRWFHYGGLAPADVKVEARTFLDVFPHVSLWLVPPVESKVGTRSLGADLLLVGSREKQAIDWARLERAFGDERIAGDLRSTRALADAPAVAAAWAMGREEMERWAKDSAVFPRGTPASTDDFPYLELVAPRRGLVEPGEAARAAVLSYQAMGKAAGDVRRAIVNQPLLDAGGPLAAVFLGRLGERYAAAAQPERAVAAYAAAAAADPASATVAARAGELLLQAGRAAEAERLLAEAVRLDPTRARAWEGLGSIFLDRRDYARAEEAHRALLRLEPANANAWLHLGAALARQGKWDGAKDALATALSIDPRAPVDPELAAYVDRQVRGVTAR